MEIKEKFGLPIVTADNVFLVLEQLGIKHWQSLGRPLSLDEYKKGGLSSFQKKEIEKFAPKLEVELFATPRSESFAGFRATWPYGMGVHVFTILPGDLVPITAEFRHGGKVISLILPGGVIDSNSLSLKRKAMHAKKEFEDETGILLKKVVPIETKDTSGILLSARQAKQRTCGFIGILPKPLVFKKTNLDYNEFLKAVLIPVKDLVKLIMKGNAKEASLIVSTFMALFKMDKIKFYK